MKIERFEVKGLAQYSYVISDGGEAVVIDAMRDIDVYLQYAQQNALRITHILETHIHADFAAGSVVLAAATGAELAFSAYDRGERFLYQMPHRSLADGDTILFGNLRLQTLYTPGHTPEHVSFLLFDLSRSVTEPIAMFSGDFLFVGSLGRPDLLGEAAKVGLAHELYRSVQQRIAALPDSLAVYPGHGAGSLCGAGMSDNADTTLGYERRTNPFFGYEENEFVTKILASVPAMPDYYPRMKELNAKGAVAFEGLPKPEPLKPQEIEAKRSKAAVTILDLRRPESFGGAHIPGAINIGSGPSLSLWAGWLLDPSAEIVLVDDKGVDEEARVALARVGLDRVTGYLAGGMPAWLSSGLAFARLLQTTAPEVESAATVGKALILDVRNDSEQGSSGIEGSQHIPLGKLVSSLAELSKTQPILTVCGSGYRSSIAASLLQRAGFTYVSNLSGGIGAWQRHHGEAATMACALPEAPVIASKV